MLCMIAVVAVRKSQTIREYYHPLRLLIEEYEKCSTELEREQELAIFCSGDHNRRLGPAL